MTRTARQWIIAVLVSTLGAAWEYGSLALVERFVSVFPAVHDPLQESLPVVNFGALGEIVFFGLILLFAIDHFRTNWRATPRVLFALGCYYFLRGWFLFLLPIGAPLGSIDPSQRLNIWGYASHAYFPGGHIGVLTVLTLLTPHRRIRRVMWVGVALFGVGTLLAKNHYTMDSVAGIMLAAGCVWLALRFDPKPSSAV